MKVFVTGTDTDVGKTLVSCVLAAALDAYYWKPIQAGTEPTTDSRSLSDWVPAERILPERYCLKAPMSPNQAARREKLQLSLEDFKLPAVSGSLVVEGAGGLMVPINQKDMIIDMMARFKLPAVLVARSGLGTLNHTLLSLGALKSRGIPCAGLIFVGPEHPDNDADLRHFGQVPVVGRIPLREPRWTLDDLPELKRLLDLGRLATG